MRGALATVVAVIGFALSSSAVHAQTISQPVDASSGFTTDGIGQSFTATVTGVVTRIRVRQAFGPPTTTLLIYNGASGSGIVGAIGTPAYTEAGMAIGTTSSNGPFNELVLATPFSVTAGQPYTFLLSGGAPGLFGTVDVYAGGTTVTNFGFVRAGNDMAFEVVQVVPVTTFSGPSATGSGTVTASFTGGGGACTFSSPQLIPVVGNPSSPPAGSAPATFPHGLFSFSTTGCTPGSTITMTMTYPAALPSGTQYYKYGPTPGNPAPHWYVLPATIVGNTATFSITDGGLGDDDLAANGTIVDQGGPGVPFAVGAGNLPTLSEWALALMALTLLGCGAVAIRGRSGSNG